MVVYISRKKFAEELADEVKRRTEAGTRVELHSITKNNGVELLGITMLKDGAYIAPTIYIGTFYEEYMKGRPIEELADQVCEINRNREDCPQINPAELFEFETIRTTIRPRLINYEMNRNLFEKVPCKRVLDLAVTFYYELMIDGLSHAGAVVRFEDLERWGITEEQLFEIAEENCRNYNEMEAEPIAEAMMRAVCEAETGFDLSEPVKGAVGEVFGFAANEGSCPEQEIFAEDLKLIVITNKSRFFGAAAMLDKELLRSVADRFGSDLYILPSSVHEVIAAPVSETASAGELEQIVREINQTQVAPTEILSNHVYMFVRSGKALVLCGT